LVNKATEAERQHAMAPEQVEVIVKLTRGGAQPDGEEHHAVWACAARLGMSLDLLHPAISDQELATYAVTHVSWDAAASVADQLRHCDGIEGAYIEPAGEPP
jgi:hypothetical protein